MAVNIMVVSVNAWAKAARAILRDAGISEATVAKQQLGISRAAFSPYLGGAREPSCEKIIAINDAIGQVTNDPPATVYLDCEAVHAGLLPMNFLSVESLADGAFLALEELCSGYLAHDWQSRLASAISGWTERRLGRFLLELNRAHRRLLRTRNRVPWREGLAAIETVLREHGLHPIVAKERVKYDRISRFRSSVSRELDSIIGPQVTARMRFGVENRILLSALALSQNGGPSLQKLLLGNQE